MATVTYFDVDRVERTVRPYLAVFALVAALGLLMPGCTAPRGRGVVVTSEGSSSVSSPATPTAASRPAVAPALTALKRADVERVQSWAMPLGLDVRKSSPETLSRILSAYDLVVLDGEETSAEQVRALRSRGAIVLGYVSVGTIEPGRSWYPLLEGYRLDYWTDWEEWYAKLSDPGFRDVIVGRVAPMVLDKGFDGLFLDNVDMIRTHPEQSAGMTEVVARLADAVHEKGGYLVSRSVNDL